MALPLTTFPEGKALRDVAVRTQAPSTTVGTQSEDANDLFRRKPAYSAALSPDKMAIAVVQVTSASPRRSGDMA